MSAKRTANCGIFAAFALVFLGIACLAPSGRLGLTAAAGLFPAFSMLAGGLKYGFLCWAASSFLGLLLLPDKGLVLLFLVAFGLYPLLKGLMEHWKHQPLAWMCKLVYFNVLLTALWLLFHEFLLSALPEWLENGILLYTAGNIVFLAYDFGLSGLLRFYAARVRKGLHKS